MPKKVKPVPDGYRTVTPSLIVKGAAKALEFYKKAFGITEIHECMKMPDGTIGHAEFKIGDSILMIAEEQPEWKATQAKFYLYVEDCDAWLLRATKAGAKPEMPATDMFWGDRCGSIKDPWGNSWTIGTRKEDLTEEQIRQRGEEWMAAAAR